MTRQRPRSKRGFGVASWLAAAAIAAALGGVAAGCDDDFEGCEASRTCPVGDAGNDSDGSTGSDARACTVNDDCIDADACNGTELCVQGSCVDGAPVECNNPDSVHCDVQCVTEPTTTGFLAACAVSGRDADSDGYADALCAQAVPVGDDCDDTNREIHPAHDELCNGIDDDCDGKIDVADGLALGGTPTAIVASSQPVVELDAAWSEAASSFGVVWTDKRDSSAGEIYFTRVDGNGNKLGSDVPVSSMISTISKQPAIAPSPDGFGVTWVEGETIYFRPFDNSGAPVVVPKIVATQTGQLPASPDLVHDGSQGWIVTFVANESTTSTPSVVWGARIDDAGAVVQTPTSLSAATGTYLFSSVARAGDVVLSQWADYLQSDHTEVRGAYRGLLLEDLSRPRISDLAENVTSPVLAASDVFFSAWLNQLDLTGVHVAVENPSTQTRACDTVGVAPSTDGTSNVFPFSAAFDGTDFVMIHARADGTEAGLTVISKSCDVVRGPAATPPFASILGASPTDIASVAAGGGRVAVVWIEPSITDASPTGRVMAQAFSAQYYCN